MTLNDLARDSENDQPRDAGGRVPARPPNPRNASQRTSLFGPWLARLTASWTRPQRPSRLYVGGGLTHVLR